MMKKIFLIILSLAIILCGCTSQDYVPFKPTYSTKDFEYEMGTSNVSLGWHYGTTVNFTNSTFGIEDTLRDIRKRIESANYTIIMSGNITEGTISISYSKGGAESSR